MSKLALKKWLRSGIVGPYHLLLAWWGALRYGFPSEKLVVIGVTGTNGKSTTANLIATVLEAAGHKVGLTSTVNFRIAGQDRLNDLKMTMPGRSVLQRMLREMVRAGCRYAVIETSSEGIKQHRHRGINYDLVVFTNLTPEHLEAHGGFEQYKRAKGKLFQHLGHCRNKRLAGRRIPKTAVVNLDDQYANYYLGFPLERRVGYTVELVEFQDPPLVRLEELDEVVKAEAVEMFATGTVFSVRGVRCDLPLPGGFNVENALAAMAVGLQADVSLEQSATALSHSTGVPGRMEFIDEGQPFKVLVDYAPEPESFRKLYGVIGMIEHQRVIHVLGSCGGGRDRDRRPILGQLAGRGADIVIVTNEDPYDDEPLAIMREVAAGAVAAGKREKENLFIIEDRGEALRRAVDMAGPDDLVVVTGKGAEQFICVAGGQKLPWDDRKQLRAALRQRYPRH